MAKKLIFKEYDVTEMSKEHLTKIFCCIRLDFGWVKCIENLEIIAIEDKIIVRGWATRHMWKQFENLVIYDHTLDYIYKEWKPEDWGL